MNKFILFTYPLLVVLTITSGYVAVTRPEVKTEKITTKIVKAILPITPTPTPRKLSDLVLNYALQAFPNDKSTAIKIMTEHNMDCEWGKGTDHVGLFAIDVNDSRVYGKDLLNCEENIDTAKSIYEEEGFSPWKK